MMIDALTETVRLATGIPDAQPRPGQKALTEAIEKAIRGTGNHHVIGAAPTGLGKSFSLLAPAMIAATELGQRTIISTESLSLLSQIVDKDAPVAADACKKLTGTRPEVAVLKGFSNYVCSQAARDTAEAVTNTAGTRPSVATLKTKLKRMKRAGTAFIDGRSFDKEAGIPLLLWALDLAENEAGDKQAYEGNLTPELWDMISVGPAECVGDTCPLFDYCKPRKARQTAGEADIVVTNHSMLAVQAAKGVPVIIGNKNLGEFHIIMVDEAHNLPNNVRNAGASEVSPATVISLVRGIGRVLNELDSQTEQLQKEGRALAAELNTELGELARGTRTGEVFKLGENSDPVENTGDILIAWARSVKNALDASAGARDMKLRLKAKRLIGRFDAFIANVTAVKLHRTGTARWIEEKQPPRDAKNQSAYWCATASPVNVGGLLAANLWTAPVLPDPEDEMAQAMKEAGEPVEEETETYDMTVISVSATLPARFGYQVGMSAENVDYPSPFDNAYDASALHIPKLGEDDISFLHPGYRPGGRTRFDSRLHQEWAARKCASLVDANAGSALVLSANTAAGKAYAEALRAAAHGRWKVYSQWDGIATRQLIQAWREDETSVLVGTKSLMTGVDAPGRTCSLVIIDRLPRNAGNPVDDARVEVLMQALSTDKWSADRFVYVEDAALLAEQAAGRLIRSMKCSGMLAVLDPRLLKSSPVSYPEPTRLIYKRAFRRFKNVITDSVAAEQYLNKQSDASLLRQVA